MMSIGITTDHGRLELKVSDATFLVSDGAAALTGNIEYV